MGTLARHFSFLYLKLPTGNLFSKYIVYRLYEIIYRRFPVFASMHFSLCEYTLCCRPDPNGTISLSAMTGLFHLKFDALNKIYFKSFDPFIIFEAFILCSVA